MPWFNYGKMTDEDLKAVYAYLRSIPPIHNRVPDAAAASRWHAELNELTEGGPGVARPGTMPSAGGDDVTGRTSAGEMT